MQTYNYKDVFAECLEYFNGDDLAASVCINKYLLTTKDGKYLEKSPKDMHKRLAKEFARIESKYPMVLNTLFHKAAQCLALVTMNN